jgi:hypothetical protein
LALEAGSRPRGPPLQPKKSSMTIANASFLYITGPLALVSFAGDKKEKMIK